MKDKDKTKAELIKELKKLQQEYDSLKTSYEKDITERKRAEGNLYESAMKLARLQKIGKLGSWEWNIVENSLWWSDEVYRIWGVGKDFALTFESIDQMIHPDDRELNLKMIQEFLANSNNGEFEFRIICPDGTIKNIYQSIETSHAPSGQLLRMFGIMQDITDRKLAEEALHASEEKHRTLIEQSIDGIVISDEHGNVSVWNKSMESITGIQQCETIGRPLWEIQLRLIPVEQKTLELLGQLRNILKNLLESKMGWLGEPREQTIIDVNGTHKVVQDSTFLIKTKNKVNFGTIIRDITARRQSEESLHQEKENFRNSLDDSPLGVRIASADGNTIYANKTILDLYGYDSLEKLQKTHLKDRYTPESYHQAQKRIKQRESGDFSATEYEISIVRKNGEIRHLQVYRKEVLWNGEKQFQVIYQDISKRKQAEVALKESEARYRSLFENSLMGISVADTDGRLVQANLAYAQMYGYKNPEEMLSEITNVGMLYANPGERKEVLRILRRKGFMEAREVEVVRRDGSRFFVLVSACEIRDSEGKLLYNQAIHIDVTDRRQTEEEIKKSKELLEKLNRHLNEIREEERALISREIHDQLGQSMTALKLDLNLMYKYLNNNTEAVAKLKGMIELVSNTIKDVQRISSDLRPGILDELGLASAIEWYCEEFERRTDIKCNLKLDNSDFSDTQINLVFFRVLQETLTNVIRHAKASSVSIKLHQSDRGVTMSIKDNGIGITKEQIESYRSLGLISMRERVKQFNGTIDISSKKDSGTKLVIFIPS